MPDIRLVPSVRRQRAGGRHLPRLRVVLRVAYVAANWRRDRPGLTKRDRAQVRLLVAGKLLTSGPDPSDPIFEQGRRHVLTRKRSTHAYSFRLPARASAALERWGVFSHKAKRRRRALQHVWVEISQDRDFQRVDGHLDWRQSVAWTAAGKPRRQAGARRLASAAGRQALMSSSSSGACHTSTPCGGLTIVNSTANGIYQDSDPIPSVIPGTQNPPDSDSYTGVPITVGAQAIQCMESTGTDGANPTALMNVNANGVPQPYAPGDAVTAQIVANDSLERASNREAASTAGYVIGGVSAGWTGATVSTNQGSTPGSSGLYRYALDIEGPDNWMSPGGIVSAGLNIVEDILANSCDEAPNLIGVGITEPGSGTDAISLELDKEGMGAYSVTDQTSGVVTNGLQTNPSFSTWNGADLYLWPYQSAFPGLAGGKDSLNHGKSPPWNEIQVQWTNYNPCDPVAGSCNVPPSIAPTVQSQTGNIDCGVGNSGPDCAFPAAGWPDDGPVVFAGTGTASEAKSSEGAVISCSVDVAYDCGTTSVSAGSGVEALEFGNGLLFVGEGNVGGSSDLLACQPSPVGCDVLDQTSGQIASLEYVGGTLFAALGNGELWACNPVAPNACQVWDTAQGDGLGAMTYGDGRLWIALSSDKLWSCNPESANSCQEWDVASSWIGALTYGNGSDGQGMVFMGLGNGELWACPAGYANACNTSLDKAEGDEIDALDYGNDQGAFGTLYAGLSSGTLWSCNPTYNNGCSIFDSLPGAITAVSYSDGIVYAGLASGSVWACNPTNANSCEKIGVAPSDKMMINSVAGGDEPAGTGALALKSDPQACIDNPGFNTANGTDFQVWDCTSGSNQWFTLASGGSGPLEVEGNCMDVPDADAYVGAPLDIYDCNGTPAQQFAMTSAGQLVVMGYCVSVPNTNNGTLLELAECSSAPNQTWAFDF